MINNLPKKLSVVHVDYMFHILVNFPAGTHLCLYANLYIMLIWWAADHENNDVVIDFRCFGSGQHLKNKFGTGYLLEVKLKSSEDDESIEKLNSFVKSQFPKSTVMEQFAERLIYKIPQSDISSLKQTFSALEQGIRYHISVD